MSVFPLWYAPAVPPELGGGHNANLGARKKNCVWFCALQLQNRAGAYVQWYIQIILYIGYTKQAWRTNAYYRRW